MASWSKRKVDASEINKGQEYTKDDNVSVEELNAIVNNSFNAQGTSQKSLNTVEGFQIGTVVSGETPSATINVDSTGEKIILNLVLPKGDQGEAGPPGDGGGTTDYLELFNKPQINGKELSGNLTSGDLGIETISREELEEKVDKVEGKDLSSNDFTNEEKNKLAGLSNYDDTEIKNRINEVENSIPDVSNFITNTVDNLVNYYTKTQTYTKEEVNSLINNISSFNALIVETLPTQNISSTTIYLIPKTDSENDDYYDEYLYINNAWEMIGNTKIDLSNYYTKSESDAKYVANVQSTSSTLGNINATKKTYSFYDGNGNIQTPTTIVTYEYGEAFYYNDDEIHLTPGGAGLMSPLDKGKLDRIDENAVNFAQEEYEKSLNEFNANLLNGVSGIVVSDNGKTITMPLATEGNGATHINYPLKELCPNMKVGETYTLNFTRNYNDGNNYIYLINSDFLWYLGTSKVITQNDLDGKIYLYANRYFDGYTEQIIMTDFMINEGTEAMPYQEYHGEIVHEKDIEGLSTLDDKQLICSTGDTSVRNNILSDIVTNYKFITMAVTTNDWKNVDVTTIPVSALIWEYLDICCGDKVNNYVILKRNGENNIDLTTKVGTVYYINVWGVR